MYGRRYSDGLHQAIEAKEGAKIQQESRTLATISIQNYFRLYQKLSGMTGTALTESEEFNKIYSINVLAIPTNVPIIRDDKADVVYKTTSAKYSAIIKEIQRITATGQPIMVGTKSIENNHIISNFLKRKKIKHSILDAKNHEKEAFIIADAGKIGSITVATNIAGRGVDIVLGGAKPELKDYRKTKPTKKTAVKADWKKVENLGISLPPLVNPNNYKLKEYAKALKDWKKGHDDVVDAGGLYIMGTERHESRRIDNQLRGRSGRQGDPGASQFFVSLEDEIMRIFGGEQIAKVMDFLKIEENQPIEHSMVGKSIESAQVKVEGFFFDQRKRLVEFDDVINRQRDIIYKRRKRLLVQSEDEQGSKVLSEQIGKYINDEITSIVTRYAPEGYTQEEYRVLIKEFSKLIPFDNISQNQLVKSIEELTDSSEIIEKLSKVSKETYAAKEKSTGSEQMRMLEKIISLSTLDQKWMDHLDAMDSLKQGIWLRGEKKTVLSEYEKEGFSMFEELIQNIESTITSKIYRVQFTSNRPMPVRSNLENAVEGKQEVSGNLSGKVAAIKVSTTKPSNVKGSLGDLASALGASASSNSTGKKINMATARTKIKRNDPCPCGSGKKYKKCGLIGAPEHRG